MTILALTSKLALVLAALSAPFEGAHQVLPNSASQEEEPAEKSADEEKEESQEKEAGEPAPRVLDEVRTRGVIGQYERADHWTVQGLVLISFGVNWHPAAASLFTSALAGKQEELRAFALEVLCRADDACLRCNATAELVDVLVESGLRERDELFRAQSLALLQRLFPDQTATRRDEWSAFWRVARESYAPADWIAPEAKEEGPGRTVSGGAVSRAMDLREAGLEICFCVDASGSMGTLLAATAGTAQQLAHVFEGFVPDFRVGAVYFKDMEDVPGGAQLVAELSNRTDSVLKKVGKITADGGGDIPEAVEKGLALALDRDVMGWRATTNKLVIVMGDAPPHPFDVPIAEALARSAHERPLGLSKREERRQSSRGGSTSAVARPFVISCIGVGTTSVPLEAVKAFKRIAAAGGGSYAALTFGEGGELDPERARVASREIVRHVLRMSFGERWEDEVTIFLSIYFDYYERGFFD